MLCLGRHLQRASDVGSRSTTALTFCSCFSQMFSTFFYDYEVVILFPSVNFWATVIIVIVLSIGPHYLFRSLKGFFFPSVAAAATLLDL